MHYDLVEDLFSLCLTQTLLLHTQKETGVSGRWERCSVVWFWFEHRIWFGSARAQLIWSTPYNHKEFHFFHGSFHFSFLLFSRPSSISPFVSGILSISNKSLKVFFFQISYSSIHSLDFVYIIALFSFQICTWPTSFFVFLW